jgi:Cft2 family RNA processing exonuclease
MSGAGLSFTRQKIDYVVVTHATSTNRGRLPCGQEGFKGKIYATGATTR